MSVRSCNHSLTNNVISFQMKMGSQQFCLRWNNHQTNMLSVFDKLLSKEAFVDVTIACEGSSIKAHKMVLSACSPFFEDLFCDNPCKHPIVILRDMRHSDLKAIIQFMYKGEINVSQVCTLNISMIMCILYFGSSVSYQS